jgi:hypothetical protein
MHVLDKFKLNRRRMLRGMLGGSAVAVGLPVLEAMLNSNGTAFAGGADLPKRFISFSFGNGVQLANWEPAITGEQWQLSPQLQPFAPVKEYLTVCTGLHNTQTSPAITHHEGMAVFSGYNYTPSNAGGFASNWGGPTIDQVIADIIMAQDPTPIRSMQVGTTKFDSPADNGTTAKAISVRGEPGNLTVLYPEYSPAAVWNNLFGEFSAPKDDREVRLGVLGAVKDDIDELKVQLGTVDRQRLDAHLDNVAELEVKISAAAPLCEIPAAFTEQNLAANGSENLTLINQLMADLMAYAFTCDVTRVASNLFCSIASESVFSDVPQSASTHHVHSHSNDAGYDANITFIMGCISALMQTLQATPDVSGGNLLDSTLIFASSELSQGWSHSWQRQPILIGGHGRGYMRNPGTHYQAVAPNFPGDDNTSAGNTTDVLLTLARCFDPAHPSIGAGPPMSTSVISEILA